MPKFWDFSNTISQKRPDEHWFCMYNNHNLSEQVVSYTLYYRPIKHIRPFFPWTEKKKSTSGS